MASSAIIGFGATLSIGGAAVAALTSLTGPGLSRDIIDLSNHDGEGYMTFASGLSDPGELSIEGMFDSTAGQDTLVSNLEAAAPVEFIITLSDTSTLTFDGFVTAFSTDAPYDGPLTFSATIKATGEVVLAGSGE